jgi:two-component system response regulator
LDDKQKLVHVVLVEDTPDDSRLACRALKRWRDNVHIVIAQDGEEALTVLRSCISNRLPDLVLLDLKLPLLSGFQVLSEIRAKGPLKELRVVVLSSSDDPSDIDRARRLGANGYVSKPVAYDEFIGAIRAIAEGWNGLF